MEWGVNMETKKLYLESIEAAYEDEFSAKVLAIEENKIVLDQTLFYPLGGGQNWDLGTLEGPNGQMDIIEVRGRESIYHTVDDSFELDVGDEVRGKIDFDRRYAHMRMHTAQHLVSGIAYEMFDGVRTVGNQIHTEKSRIDFKPLSIDQPQIDEIQSTVNDYISKNLKIKISEELRENLENNTEIRSSMSSGLWKMLPSSVKKLRVITIGDIDICPCAGTHVRSLGEIGQVEFTNKKNKGSQKLRLSYKLNDF